MLIVFLFIISNVECRLHTKASVLYDYHCAGDAGIRSTAIPSKSKLQTDKRQKSFA